MTLALALLWFAPSFAQEPAPAPPRLRGVCILAGAASDALADDPDGAAELLEHHARCHGWRLDWDGGDWVDAAHAAACPTEALRAMREAYASDPELRHPVALALERNGRVDEVLALLADEIALGRDAGTASMDRPLRAGRSGSYATLRSAPSELAARIALRHGRHADVVEFARTWDVQTGCGNCTVGRERRRGNVVARARAALGHDDEVRRLALARDALFGWRDPETIAVWIGLERERYPGLPLDALVAKRIAPFIDDVPEVAAAVAILRARAIVEIPPDAEFDAFVRHQPDAAARHVLSLDGAARAALLDAPQRRRSPYSETVQLFAALGLPELEAWFDAAPERERLQIRFVRARWELAHRAWLVLTAP